MYQIHIKIKTLELLLIFLISQNVCEHITRATGESYVTGSAWL